MIISLTLRDSVEHLKMCFYADKLLAVRIILFIITGFWALWMFVAECIFLFLIRLLQVVGDETREYIKNSELPASVRCVVMLIVSPIIYVKFVALPFLYMPFWVVRFFYNCVAFATSLGKSGWKEPHYG